MRERHEALRQFVRGIARPWSRTAVKENNSRSLAFSKLCSRLCTIECRVSPLRLPPPLPPTPHLIFQVQGRISSLWYQMFTFNLVFVIIIREQATADNTMGFRGVGGAVTCEKDTSSPSYLAPVNNSWLPLMSWSLGVLAERHRTCGHDNGLQFVCRLWMCVGRGGMAPRHWWKQ